MGFHSGRIRKVQLFSSCHCLHKGCVFWLNSVSIPSPVAPFLRFTPMGNCPERFLTYWDQTQAKDIYKTTFPAKILCCHAPLFLHPEGFTAFKSDQLEDIFKMWASCFSNSTIFKRKTFHDYCRGDIFNKNKPFMTRIQRTWESSFIAIFPKYECTS